MPRDTRFLAAFLLVFLLSSFSAAASGASDWLSLSETREVDVLGHDADGDPGEVVMWRVVEGQGSGTRVLASFREQYGWLDAALNWMGGSLPPILQHLSPDSSEEP